MNDRPDTGQIHLQSRPARQQMLKHHLDNMDSSDPTGV